MTDLDRIPHALAPFVRLPKARSQTLITSVLGASSNWLLLQLLAGILGNSASRTRAQQGRDAPQNAAHPAAENVAVILISWMQDWDFWRTEARRSLGIELNQLSQAGRLAFIDGLTDLFAPERERQGSSRESVLTATQEHRTALRDPTLGHLQQTVADATTRLKATGASHVVLVLDSPSILLHTTKPPIDSLHLTELLLKLRANVHSLIVSLYADDPFVAPASALDVQDPGVDSLTWTPLEIDNASFVIGLAHQSRMLFQCRRLDTGWAEHISGVIRISKGPMMDDEDGEGVEDGEWLYFVAADGTVTIWSRASTT